VILQQAGMDEVILRFEELLRTGVLTPGEKLPSEPELARAVSEGRRREFATFGWTPEEVPDPQDPETFHRSKLNWQELAAEPHADLLAWYRCLIAIRKSVPELQSPMASVVFDEHTGLFVMHRPGISVVCNFGAKEIAIPDQGGRLLLASDLPADEQAPHTILPPESVSIVETHTEERRAAAEAGVFNS